MLFNEEYILKQIKRLMEYNQSINAVLTAIVNNLTNAGGVMVRDSRTLPTEPPPTDTTKVWLLTFRNGAPGLTWDPTQQAWI